MTGGVIRQSEYTIASGYATSIFTGDVVESTGTGKNIAKAAGANPDNLGRFCGCRYVNAQGEQKFSRYWPASTVATDIVAYVMDDPFIVYEVQCDTLAEADVGLLADWNVGTGSTATGQSGLYLVASGGATSGQSMRIIGLVPRAGNGFGAYARAEVLMVEHVMVGNVAGAGGV
jgi:hypothetical protein